LRNALTMENVLDEIKTVSDSDASFTWASDEFLLEQGVIPWIEMPLWIPEEKEDAKGFMFINSDKAIAAGLRFRALDDTIRDTLTWFERNRPNEKMKAGIESEKEQALIRKWHEKSDSVATRSLPV